MREREREQCSVPLYVRLNEGQIFKEKFLNKNIISVPTYITCILYYTLYVGGAQIVSFGEEVREAWHRPLTLHCLAVGTPTILTQVGMAPPTYPSLPGRWHTHHPYTGRYGTAHSPCIAWLCGHSHHPYTGRYGTAHLPFNTWPWACPPSLHR